MRGKTRVVHLSEIKTDAFVNRTVDEAWVNKLVSRWDPELMGIPVVASENGHYVVVDGQHRLAALREMAIGDPRVEVEVLEGKDKPGMAHDFIGRNTTRPVLPFDKFEKLVNSGDATANHIVSILKTCGLHLNRQARERAVGGVVALQGAYAKDGKGEILRLSLSTLRSAFGDGPESFNGNLILGLATFFQSYPDADQKRTVATLARSAGGASGLLGKGRTIREVYGHSVAHGVATAALNLYNRGLKHKLGE